MNTGGSVVVGGAIIAVVELLKRYIPSISAQTTIFVAAALGLVAGLLGLDGLNVVTGVALGLASSGVHQIATAAGGK